MLTNPEWLLFISFLDIKRDALMISPGLDKPVAPTGHFTGW
jgi:hypothetical protein